MKRYYAGRFLLRTLGLMCCVCAALALFWLSSFKIVEYSDAGPDVILPDSVISIEGVRLGITGLVLLPVAFYGTLLLRDFDPLGEYGWLVNANCALIGCGLGLALRVFALHPPSFGPNTIIWWPFAAFFGIPMVLMWTVLSIAFVISVDTTHPSQAGPWLRRRAASYPPHGAGPPAPRPTRSQG